MGDPPVTWQLSTLTRHGGLAADVALRRATGNKKAASVLRVRPGVRSDEDQAAAGRRSATADVMVTLTWAVILRLLSEGIERSRIKSNKTGSKHTTIAEGWQIRKFTNLRSWLTGNRFMSRKGAKAQSRRGFSPWRLAVLASWRLGVRFLTAANTNRCCTESTRTPTQGRRDRRSGSAPR